MAEDVNDQPVGEEDEEQSSDQQQILDDLTVLSEGETADDDAERQIRFGGETEEAEDQTQFFGTIHTGSQQTQDEVEAGLPPQGQVPISEGDIKTTDEDIDGDSEGEVAPPEYQQEYGDEPSAPAGPDGPEAPPPGADQQAEEEQAAEEDESLPEDEGNAGGTGEFFAAAAPAAAPPTTPTTAATPTEATDASEPTEPTEPTTPTIPTTPTTPSDPITPSEDSEPSDPTQPSEGTDPSDSSEPTDPTEASDPGDVGLEDSAGVEDTSIALSISLPDGADAGTAGITLSNIPNGAVLTSGGVEIDVTGGSAAVTGAQLADLSIAPPEDSSLDFTLDVAVDLGDGSAVQTGQLDVSVDPDADAPTLDLNESVTGTEDTAIDLGAIGAQVTDISEDITDVTISDIPAGSVITVGGVEVTVTNNSVSVPLDQLNDLAITPPQNFNGSFSLTVTATSTDVDEDAGDDTTDTASTAHQITVNVDPDADPVEITFGDASGDEDTAIALDITPQTTGDETVVSVTLDDIPPGAVLTSNGVEIDTSTGSATLTPDQLSNLTITPPADSDVDIDLQVTVLSDDGGVTRATTEPYTVAVETVADTPTLDVGDGESGGLQATPIDIGFSSGVTDADEALSVTISGVPTGATLSAGTDNGDGVWTISTEDLAADPTLLQNLTVTPPPNFIGTMNLTVTSTSTDTDPESGNVDTASSSSAITVAVASDGSITVEDSAGVEDTAIPLDISVPDVEGVTTTVTLSGIPDGAVLTANGEEVTIDGGSAELTAGQLADLTITPPHDSDVDFSLDVTITQNDGVSDVVTDTTLDVAVDADADMPALDATETASGEQATPVPLDISSALTDLDGSESLSVTLSGMPPGATLSAGIDNGDGTWTLSQGDLDGLTVTPPQNYTGTFDLSVTSTATEADGGDQESWSEVIAVTVDAEATEPSGPTGDADTPTLSSDSVTGAEDNWIDLDISAGLTDETETLSVTLGDIPDGATFSYVDELGETVELSPTAGGTLVLSPEQLDGLAVKPPQDYFGDFNLTVTATSADGDDQASITQTFGVTVTPVLDNPVILDQDVSGEEDSRIELNLDVSMAPETTVDVESVIISNIPDGAVLEQAILNEEGKITSYQVIDVENGFATLSRDELANLFITPPPDFQGDFDLTVTAVSEDGGVDVETFNVEVTDQFEAEDATGVEDQAGGIALNIDAGGNAEVTISGVPEGASLSAGTFEDGSWTVAAEDLDNLKLILPEDLAGTFDITVTGGDDTITFAVNVDAVADAPSIDVALAGGNEDTAIALDIDVGLNDTDGSETITSVTISGVPDGAALSAGIDNQDGTWTLARGELDGLTITPPDDFNGQIELGITAVSTETASGDTAASTTTLTVEVANVNDGPAAQAESVSATEDGAVVTGQLDATDIDGDTLTYTLVEGLGAEQGTLTLNADGSYSYDPGHDFQGLAAGETQELTFTYQVDDGQGVTSTAVGTIKVTGTNDGPAAEIETVAAEEDGAVVTGQLDATDVDGDDLTFTLLEGPSEGSVVVNADGTYSFDPGDGFQDLGLDIDGNPETREVTFTYQVDDGHGGISTATATVTVSGNNDAPEAEDEAFEVTEDDPTVVAGQLDATDADGDNLQYQLVDTPTEGNLTFNSDGTYTFDPGDDFQDLGVGETRDVTLTYQVTDAHGGSDTGTMTITVKGTNDGPVATDDALSAVEDTVLPFTAADLTGNDTDVDGDALSITAFDQPDGGTVTRNDDGSFAFTPNPDFSGQTTFTYTIEDESGETSTATVTLNVAATADGVDLTVQPATGDEDTSIPLSIAATGEDGGETLSVTLDGIPDGAVLTYVDGNNETQTISFTGTSATLTPAQLNGLAITPPDDSDADFTLTVTAVSQDGEDVTSVSQELQVTVDAVADAPEVTAADVSGNEGTAISLDLSAVRTDTDGSESLTVSLSGIPDGAVLTAGGEPLTVVDGAVELTQAQLGSLAITPPEDVNGSFDLTLTATSEEAVGGDTAVSSQVFTVNVGEVNDGPVAVDDAASTGEDSAVTLNVLGNDTDADGDALSVTAVSLPDGVDGTVGINPDGSITFTPGDGFDALAENETQQVEITYTISDGQGGTSTATATVTVTGSNDGPVASDDSLSGDEDQAITFTAQDLLGNDVDAEDDALSILDFDQPEHGTVVQNGDGTFTFTPNDDFSGQTTFTYTVADPSGETSTATVTIDVTSDNDGPIAVADQISVDEDGEAQGVDVLDNDSDPDGGTLSITNVAMPEGIPGTLTIDNHGDVVYDPEDNYQDLGVGESTSFDVTYTVSDGQGGTSSAAVTVTVHGTNDGPQAETVALTAAEDGAAVSGQLEASDIDGDTLAFALVEGPSEGTVTIGTDGTYTFTPGTDFQDLGVDESREVTFTYQVDDGHGGVSTAVGTVTVTGTNDGPEATADTLLAGEDGGAVSVNVLGNDTDADGDTLIVTDAALPAGVPGALSFEADGTISYDPGAAFQDLGVGESTSFDVAYTISDGMGGTSESTVTITVEGTNDGPQAQAEPVLADEDGVVVSGQLDAADIDGDDLTFSLVEGLGDDEGTLILNADGSYSYDPAQNFQNLAEGETQELTFTYQVSDGQGGTSTAVGTITVTGANDGPKAEVDTLAANEDGGAVTVDVLANDTDVDGDTLSIASATLPDGIPGTVSYDDAGNITYNPEGGFQELAEGEETSFDITYTISDGQGGTSEATVTVTVTGSNDGPQAEVEAFSLGEDAEPLTGQLTATDVDTPAENLEFSLVEGPAEGTLTIEEDGSYTFTPGDAFQDLAAGETQELTFTYQVADGQGGTSTAVGTIMVTGSNDGPQAQIDTLDATEDGGAVTVDVLANDTDVDGDGLSITSATLPDGIPGTVSYDEDGNITYNPGDGFQELAAGEETSFDVTYTISDGQGGTSEATVTVTVTGTNDGPQAQAETVSATEDGDPVTGQLDAADIDGDDLTFSLIDGLGDNEGTLTLNADGSYSYDPGQNFQDLAEGETQELTFTYQVSDGEGGTATAIGTITVTGTNDGPVANTDSLSGDEDQPIGFTAADLLGNDTDIDGDTLTISSFEQPDGGTVTQNDDGTFTFTPDENFNGETSFTYTVSDGQGGSSTATVTIDVEGVNDGPVAQGESVLAQEDGNAVTGQLDATDVDGDSLTFALVDGPSEGSVTVNADGSYEFDPGEGFQDLAAGETREVTFTYEVSDGQGGTSTAVGTVTVTGSNDGPIANADTLAAIEDGGAVSVDVLGNDTDAEGDTLTVTGAVLPDGVPGSLTFTEDGTISYNPGDGFQNLAEGEQTSFDVTYTISDGEGGTSESTVTVTVTGSNDGPVAEAEAVAATENGDAVTGQLDATDVDGDSLTFSLIEGTSEGSVTVNADGSYSFDPGEGFQDLAAGETREVTFTYEISDGEGGTSTAVGTVTVTGTNDGPVANVDTLTATEDAGAVSVNVLTNDTDVDGDALSVTAASLPDGVPGTLTFEADGTISYDPGTAFQELGVGEQTSFEVTYTISDGEGGTSESTVTIIVEGSNDGPIAQAESVSATENGDAVTGQLDATDIDGDVLTFSLVEGTSEGTVTVNADGSFSFTPGDDFQDLGVDETREVTFTYQVSDGEGGTATAVGTVTVTGTNDGPQAQAESVAATENGGAVTGQLDATDVDGDSLTFSLVEGTSEGTVSVNADGSYSFDPGEGFQDLAAGETREVTFTYEVSDGEGGTSTAVGTVTVTGTNDGPVANADSLAGTEDQAISFTAADLLGNDTDVDGDTLTVSSFSQPDGGTVTQHPDGSFTFTPDENFSGETTFTYTVSDGEGGTSTATVTIDIDGVADAPTFDVADSTGDEDTAIALDIDIGVADASENLTITLDGIPPGAVLASGGEPIAVENGSATLTQDQLETLTITPPEDSNVDFQLTVTATSQDGDDVNTVTGTIDVDVTGVADDPNLDAAIGDGTVSYVGGTPGSGEDNDFVDNGGQSHAGTGDDDTFIVDRDLRMNENFEMGGGDDTVVVNGDTSQGHNFNMGDGNDSVVLNGDIGGNTAVNGGSGNDVLYLGKDSSSYELQNFTNNQGHINTQIVDLDTGNVITVNNVEAIAFGDGEVVGNADLVETGGTAQVTYDLDIASSLNDTDNSETLSVTVSGLPEGAELSAGVDNGDGTWTLEPGDLAGLTVTVTGDDSGDAFSFTVAATSRENDGDTATVTRTLTAGGAETDLTADGADIDVVNAAGAEDTAIALDIDVSLLDTDGSESVTSITISGVPSGAELSAGTDNGDGTWTLEPGDLAELTVTPPDDSNVDFQLTVAVTTTEEASGETATTTATIDVDVTGVADTPALTATLGDGTVTSTGGTETDVSITAANYDAADSGFTVTARSVNSDGTLSEASADNVSTSGGLGVSGSASGPDDQLGYSQAHDVSEELIVDFDNDVSSISFDFARAYADEGGSGADEQGVYEIYRDGVKVGEGTFKAGDGNEGTVTVSAPDGGGFDRIVFTADEAYSDGSLNSDGSDYLITSVDFTQVEGGETTVEYPLNISSALADTDGSETLTITVDDLPDGAVLSAGTQNDDGSWTLTSGDLDGLTVQVTGDNAGDSFDFTVTATAKEDDGDTNTVSTTLSAGGVDLDDTAEGADIDVTDAAGSEDTAIALDIDVSLLDTDGSESITSITISGVPSGAELSAGTDNNDGTWTLEPGDLAGLTITPPSDSNADFQLTVSVVTEEENGGATGTATATIDVDVTGVADTPTVDADDVSGSEDGWISLDISAVLADTDGSEDLTVTISGVPDGAQVSHGSVDADGNWTIDADDVGSASIKPPADFSGDINLTLTATSAENDGDTATVSQDFTVSVAGVADDADLDVSDASGNEDTAIALNISAAATDSNESVSSITLTGVPGGAVLSAGTDNSDGTWTLEPGDLQGLTITPPANSNADFQLGVSVVTQDGDTTTTATATVNVDVTGVADAPTLTATISEGTTEGGATAVEISQATVDAANADDDRTVVVSGVPEGATLSGGTDNGDGTWTLSGGDLADLTVTPADGSTDDMSLSFSVVDPGGSSVNVLSADFNTGDDGFSYSDDTFNDTDEGYYATGGEYGGALYVGLGGQNDHGVEGMSGGHSTSFTVDDSGSGTLTFSYRMWMDNEYESNEFSQVIVEIDGQRVELDGNDFIAQLNGGGDTGWQTVTIDVGDLGEGAHTITFGGYNNLKTTDEEQTFIQFDDIALDVESDESAVATETVDVSPDAAMVAFDLDVSSSLLDTDGSESLTVTLDGLPDGAVLFAGEVEITVENGSATLTSGQLGDLTLKVPEGSDDFDLAVTATATEDDGDTATTSTTLSVDVPVSDTDADGAAIDTTEAAGIEDTAIELDIDVTMQDGDGSETVSITISGVPDGAVLSAGTDNDDGTWTLTEEDLAGLSITPPDDSNQDFTLTITAVTTETASGETSSVSTTLDVDLTGDADAPILTASLGEPTVSATGGEEVEVSIDCDSFTDTDNGFTVTGRSVNWDGSLSEASADNLTYNSSPGGFGVAGDASGDSSELGYDDDTNTSEQIVVSFDDDVSSADVSFAWMHSSEEAKYEIYRDGVKVGEGTVQGETDNVDAPVTLTADDGGSFDQIVFSAPGDDDDYLLHSIDFTRVEGGETTVEYPLDISSALTDTDGSESLTITVSDLPDGAVLSVGTQNGDGTWTLSAGDLDGLTVTLSGDDPGQAFDFTVTATATENDGDVTSVSTTLTSEGVDLDTTVEGATTDASDASGNEDAAIALDIDVGLADSDGSETVTAITVSGVPDGATLSAGTDNGDGTWTLDADDLEGLSITPPANSNEDFQLTVSVTVEEENGGATSTTSTTFDVEVAGVADAPTLSVDVGEGTATSNPGTTPVAYWNVDETSGRDLNDQIGGHDGRTYGSGSGSGYGGGNYLDLNDSGEFGTAVEFNSHDDQYVKVDHSPDLKPDSGALTMWFNADKVSGSGMYTLASSDSQGYDSGGHFGLYIDDGQLKLRMQGDNDQTEISGGDVDKDEWNQVTVTWGEDGAKVYLNGELVASDPDWTRGLSGNENPWTFGASQSHSGDNSASNLRDFFDGHMDDIALYDQQLSGEQVAALFDDGVQEVMESDTGGGNGTAYPVTITTALADTDGSESLSVTITGLPDGATLSAGTDNGDGTWTLVADDVGNLTITVPAGSDDFDLAVTATATEDDGDTRSVSSTVSVEAPEGDPVERPDSFDHTGTAGGDTISGGYGVDAIDGGAGNDVIYGDKSWDTGSAAGDDVIFAGDGNDYVEGGGGGDQIAGEAGDDVLIGDHYWDTSNAGNDTIDGGAGNDAIAGSDGDDHLYGDDGNDVIYGDLTWQTGSGAGDDTIDGGAGNDTIYGGEAADQIDGGAGNDVIYGDLDYDNTHDGGDTVDGGAGDDTIYGGGGSDTLTGGEGDDDAYGGDGSDLFIFGAGDGADYFHGGDGWSDTVQLDSVNGGPGGDAGWTLQLDDGANWTETENGIEFGGEASGKIELADGSELTFEGVEKLEW